MPVDLLEQSPATRKPRQPRDLLADVSQPPLVDAQVAPQSQPTAPDRSVLGEFGATIGRGIYGAFESGAGLGRMAAHGVESAVGKNIVSDTLKDYGDLAGSLGEAGKAGIPRSPETSTFTARNIAGTIGEALPQLAAQVGAAVATGGTSLPVQLGVFALTGAAPVVGQQYNEALRAHGDPNKAALEAGAAGLITTGTNLIPGMALFRKSVPGGEQALRSAAARIAGKMVAGGAAESVQEMSEQLLIDAVAAKIRENPVQYNQQYWEQIGLAGIAGAILGGAAGGGLAAASTSAPDQFQETQQPTSIAPQQRPVGSATVAQTQSGQSVAQTPQKVHPQIPSPQLIQSEPQKSLRQIIEEAESARQQLMAQGFEGEPTVEDARQIIPSAQPPQRPGFMGQRPTSPAERPGIPTGQGSADVVPSQQAADTGLGIPEEKPKKTRKISEVPKSGLIPSTGVSTQTPPEMAVEFGKKSKPLPPAGELQTTKPTGRQKPAAIAVPAVTPSKVEAAQPPAESVIPADAKESVNLSHLKYPQLRARAKELGLDSRGTIQVLRERIQKERIQAEQSRLAAVSAPSQVERQSGIPTKGSQRSATESSPRATLSQMSGQASQPKPPETSGAPAASESAGASSVPVGSSPKSTTPGTEGKQRIEKWRATMRGQKIESAVTLDRLERTKRPAIVRAIQEAESRWRNVLSKLQEKQARNVRNQALERAESKASDTLQSLQEDLAEHDAFIAASRERLTAQAKPSPSQSTEIEKPSPKRADLVMKEGKLDADATLRNLPPVPKGHVRLFRGEHPTSQDTAIWEDAFGERADGGRGGWFTDDIAYADYFRQTQGRGAQIVYIDVPAETAEARKLQNQPGLLSGLSNPDEPAYFFPELRTTGTEKKGKPQRRGIALAPSLKVPLSVLKRNFTAAGDLPQPVFAAKVSKDAWTNSMLLQARFTLRDFDKAARAAYNTKRLSLPQQTAIDGVLKGEADAETLPEPLRDIVRKMRDEVDALSRKMIDVGAVEGPMAAVIESNMGVYLTRSYRAFDDPKWASKVPQDIRNKAKALLRSEYPGKSEAEIDGLIEALLYEGKAAESPIAFLKGSKLGAKDLSILTKRKGIAPEIRALWGEYRDPRQNYARSVAKMAHLVANHQFLTEIRRAGMDNFFHEQPIVKDEVAYKTRIAADESSVMHPLNGLYTTPEIKTAFEEAFSAKDSSWYFRTYMRLNGLVKYSKTVLSITTHIRNLQSNTGFAVANGHWRLWKMKGGVNATMASIGAKSNPEWRAYYKHLVEIGVVNESPRANELHDVIRDASKKSADELMDTGLENIHKRLGRLATDIYRAEDDVWKIFAFENEKARYAKAYPAKSEADIDKIAAEIVRNTYPTYTMVPRAIRGLRRFPLVGTFVSFPWEVGRTGYHTLRLAAKELADPKLRTIGAQRAVGVAMATTLTGMIASTTRMLLGVSDEDDEDIRRFLPPWSENSQLAYVGRGKDGRPLVIDLSYVDPYNYLRTPVIALMRGKDWEESLWKATKEAFNPFFGEEILAGKLFDIARNKRFDGGPIWNPQDSVLQKTQDAALHVADALEPGTMTGLRRVYRGLTGYVSPYGREYNPAVEALAMLTGQRVADVDIPTAISFKARRYSRDLVESTRIMSTKIASRGTVDDDAIRSSVKRMMNARREIFDEAYRDSQAAIRQGMTHAQVFRTMRDAGLSEDNARAMILGRYLPYKMSDAMRERIIDSSKDVAERTGRKAGEVAKERLRIFLEEERAASASTANDTPPARQ